MSDGSAHQLTAGGNVENSRGDTNAQLIGVADTVDTVTPYLVEGMLNAKENGSAVRWLTRRKILWRFFINRFRKRDIFTPLGL